VIDCSNLNGSIYSTRGGIVIKPNEAACTTLPLADVAVLLIGPSVKFSSAVMHRILDADVSLILTDWKGVPEGGAYSWCEHGRVGARHRAQTMLSVPRQKNAWARLIRAKVLGQSTTLKILGRPHHNDLSSWAKLIRSGDPANIEGRAARLYWQSLWENEEFRRTPGIPGHGASTRNAQLDYAYTVLRGLGIRAVIAAGLSPTIGLFHHGRSNNFSLVDDLIEPFRPAVDYGVAQLPFDADMAKPETRKHLVCAASRKFTTSGLSIGSVLEDLAQSFGQYVEGDISALTTPQWRGPV
jgi:CRISPR-associated protein Cas1